MKLGIRVFEAPQVREPLTQSIENRVNSSASFEIYHRCHPRELKKKRKGKREKKKGIPLNQCINLCFFEENHLHMYSQPLLKLAQQNAGKKSLPRYMARYADMSLYRTASFL